MKWKTINDSLNYNLLRLGILNKSIIETRKQFGNIRIVSLMFDWSGGVWWFTAGYEYHSITPKCL